MPMDTGERILNAPLDNFPPRSSGSRYRHVQLHPSTGDVVIDRILPAPWVLFDSPEGEAAITQLQRKKEQERYPLLALRTQEIAV